ncbi:hypothetical protein FB446DRAFT_796806 [Lentinula raphanica]|nr:hypothetical protein FB446DRAFT_796806 [Lentinula raphanica]
MADVWSFNLRNHNIDSNFSDPDSDSDSGIQANNDTSLNTTSASALDETETQDIEDFDLSSREEAVLYKPNPFSIAKINAASRAKKFTALPQKSGRQMLVSKTPSSAKGTILDCFKNQNKKTRPNASFNASDAAVIAPSNPDSQLATRTHLDDSANFTDTSLPKRVLFTERCASIIPIDYDHDSTRRPKAHIVSCVPSNLNQRKLQPRQVPYTFSSPGKPTPAPALLNIHFRNRAPASSPAAPQSRKSLVQFMQSQLPVYPRSPTGTLANLSPVHSCSALPDHAGPPQTKGCLRRNDTSVHIRDTTSLSRPPQFELVVPPIPRQAPSPHSLPDVDDPNLRDMVESSYQEISQCSSPLVLSKAVPRPGPTPDRRVQWKCYPSESAQPDPYNSLLTEDEDWCTLEPARKKAKQTPKFTLGGLGVLNHGRKTGMSAESSRRVITFLPPPLESKRQTPPRNNHGNVCIDSPEELAHAGEVLSLHVHQSNQLESDWDSGSYHGEKKFAALLRNTPNPYPSPHASTLLTDDCSPSETNIGHAATKAHSVAIPYRPPSPPTSDPPEQSRNGKTALLDMKDISRQYQATRTMVRKRRHESQNFFDDLDSAKCGIVFWPWEQESTYLQPITVVQR